MAADPEVQRELQHIHAEFAVTEADYVTVPLEPEENIDQMPPEQRGKLMAELEERMREAARRFDFKQAATYRDRIQDLKARAVTDLSVT